MNPSNSLMLDEPNKSLYDAVDYRAVGQFKAPPGAKLGMAEIVDGLDVTVRECGLMKARCGERLKAMRGKFGRLPKFGTEDYERFAKADKQRTKQEWRTAVAEADWQRAIAELKHFQEMRRAYLKNLEDGRVAANPPHWTEREPGADDLSDLPF